MRKSPLDGSADELEKKARKPPSEAKPDERGYYGSRASLPHHSLPVFRFRSFATSGSSPRMNASTAR